MPVNWTPTFENLFSAGYNPQPNPLYGAQYVTPKDHPDIEKPMWIDVNGNDVSSQITNLPPEQQQYITSTPFHAPGFFRSLSPLGEQVKESNMAAEQYPGLQAQQRAAEQQRLIGNPSAQTLGNIGAANILKDQPVNTIAAMSGQGNFSPQNFQQMYQSQSDINSGVIPALTGQTLSNIGANAALARRTIAENPTEANPLISRNIMREQGYDVPLGQMSKELETKYPGIGGGGLLIGNLNPETGGFSTMRNPVPSLQSYMLGNALPGGTGGQVFGTSSGNMYTKPSAQISVPPIGMLGQTSQLPDAIGKKVVPLNDYPDFSTDYSTGRIYYKGQDVTNDPRIEPIKQSAIQQGSQKEQEVKESEHDAVQSSIAAKIAELKAQQKQLQAEHHRSGWIPAEYQNMKQNQWNLIRNTGQWFANDPIVKYTKNNLIGQ